ncbi:MAG: hypothetical protein JXA89_07475 [Anaerolineae bacterium]|nr:hypothetical protein [Anaerolineae bacterium]
MRYDFQRQLQQGRQGEDRLDRYFSRWCWIKPGNHMEQRMGIDRIFTNKETGERWLVEYKTDFTAGRTGNAFVETTAVENAITHKPGWAFTSRATHLVYYVPADNIIFIFEMGHLRSELGHWLSQYPTRDVANIGYTTRGILVPLDEFQTHAIRVLDVTERRHT